MSPPQDFSFELQFTGLTVAGVDEAGRGPWAGPVVAAAVILDAAQIPDGIDDSKRLRPAAREKLYKQIMLSARAAATGIASVEEIDRLNILNASMLAMQRAVKGLPIVPGIAVIDGNRAPALSCTTRCIVEGDARCLSIAAASILAKVTRDRMMRELADTCPAYGFERNAGYGTPEHRKALQQYGVTPHHRKSFAPVRALLEVHQVTEDAA